jgi:Carbamoyl-phosphate synthase L chain, ATP binding domain
MMNRGAEVRCALIVATETDWISTAHMPSALRAAQFEVAVVAPRGALVFSSDHIAIACPLPESCTSHDWINVVAQTAVRAAASLILPADDMSFRLLASFALRIEAFVAKNGKAPSVGAQSFAELIQRSLGDSRYYLDSVDKLALPGLAAKLNVRMPRSAVAESLPSAQRSAKEFGYPVMVKRGFGAGGRGVRSVSNEAELYAVVAPWLVPAQDALGALRTAVLIQERVTGISVYYAVAAWRGELLGGWAGHKLEEHPKGGPGTVSRGHRNDAARTASKRIVEGLGMSGVFGIEFIVSELDGSAVLIEINRRTTPGSSRGRAVNVDLLGALSAAMDGREFGGRRDLDEGEEHIRCFFPQEYLRDPDSAYLRRYPSEIPWDDPSLARKLFDRVT